MQSFELVSAKGAIIRTFCSREQAMKWLRAERSPGVTNATVYPGCKLEAVERIETRRKVWSQRADHLRVVA